MMERSNSPLVLINSAVDSGGAKTQFNCDMCDSCYKTKLGLKNTFYQFMKIKDLDVQNVLPPRFKKLSTVKGNQKISK